MNSQGPDTAAVVVNFRTADDAIEALWSLQASDPHVSRIIVVDNGSGDDSASRIASRVTGVHLIEEHDNRGFAAGCNVGIRRALQLGADTVLLLNPDATVAPRTLVEMLRLLDADEAIGIVGPTIVSKTEPKKNESSGICWSRTTGRMRNLDFGRDLAAVDRLARRDVDAVSGCAMLVKRAVFERIGFFDEDYFFGFEDVDFCLRASDAGFKSAVSGRALVEHEGQASIRRSSGHRIYFATRNHLRVAARSSPKGSAVARAIRAAMILGFNFAYTLRATDVPRLEGFRGLLTGARDHFAGRYGPGTFKSRIEPARR